MAANNILTTAKAWAWHVVKNVFLLSLSLVFLPINTAVIVAISIWGRLRKSPTPSKVIDDNDRKTILVTGVSMAKGLALARLFHRRGHRVIGADVHLLAIGRVSSALDHFDVLPTPSSTDQTEMEDEDDPYILRLLQIVRDQGVDLWVSVSDVNNAIRDALAAEVIEAHTSAKVVQLGQHAIRRLHEKDAFMEHTRRLGLPVPETEVVSSRVAVVDFLHAHGGLTLRPGGKHYILKPIGVDDVARNDAVLVPADTEHETFRRLDSVAAFSRHPSTSEKKTLDLVDEYHEKSSLLVQEFIRGAEFCTHALVVKGKVRAFTACPSSGLLMHYAALSHEAPLFKTMLAFTRIMAAAGGEAWTGHVSFDFMVKAPVDSQVEDPSDSSKEMDEKGESEDMSIYPIECNPRVHTAIVLFNDTPEVVDEYLSVLEGQRQDHISGDEPVFPSVESGQVKQYYWIGQDLVERVVQPLSSYLQGTVTRGQLAGSVREFAWHVQSWKDGTFEAWDPWPWWWLYHVYWPMRFLGFLVMGRRWTGLNVSTGKAFMAG